MIVSLSYYHLFILTFLLPYSTASVLKRSADRPSPVILVPGDGGSQLEAKLDKPSAKHYFCNKKSNDYFSLWLNLELLVPYVIDCWVDNIRLVYDNVTRTTSNSPGVDIRIPDFGNTTSVDWLDPSQISPSAYFINVIQMLLKLGYEQGVDVRGAPYDFRKAPNEMATFYSNIKNLTEDTFARNQNTSVTFVCHSMGCPIMSYFFNQQEQSWKDTYVKALVSLGGAWGGAVKAMKTFASGENLGVFVISQISVREEQRTSPSLAYMMPSDLLWRPDEVLVTTDKSNITVTDFYRFFQDIDYPSGYEMFKDSYSYAHTGLKPPGVEVHCLHGLNITNTIEGLDFRGSSHFPENPKLLLGDGDGTVNARSLEACRIWQGMQPQKVFHVPLLNVDHMGILADLNAIQYIKKVVTQ